MPPAFSIPKRVLVVGAGGLGCPATWALARAGVAHLTLVDDDRVDVSNVHRQPWHHLADVGRLKVESAAEKLKIAFPGVDVAAEPKRVTASDAPAWFAGYDLVIDATDGVETKFLLSDAAVATKVPLIYAGVVRFEGLVMRVDANGPCLRCLFEAPPPDAPTCAQVGVLGSMTGLVGGIQAWLATRPSEAPSATLHVIDGRSLQFRRVRVKRRADCAACGPGAALEWKEPAAACTP